MTAERTYPHGVTCWIDTEQADLEAANRFYSGLFGWTLTKVTPPGAPQTYLITTFDGRDVGGIGSGPDGPARWNTFVAVDDADATADAIAARGGKILSPPMDAGPPGNLAGRNATCADPAGAEFRLWQAGHRLGSQHINAPSGWNFSNLHTPDRDEAMAFYAPLFGWKAVDMQAGGWTMLQVPGYGDHLAATVDPGIYDRQSFAPPGFADVIGGLGITGAGEPARWEVVFTVANRDESAATAERLGATIVGSAEDMWTRRAFVRDPQGAEFTISQFTPPS